MWKVRHTPTVTKTRDTTDDSKPPPAEPNRTCHPHWTRGTVSSTWTRVTGTGPEWAARWAHAAGGVLPPRSAPSHSAPSQTRPHSPEGLVGGPEPAHVAAGGEEQQPEQGQPEVGSRATADPPGKAGDEVDCQGGAVDWRGRARGLSRASGSGLARPLHRDHGQRGLQGTELPTQPAPPARPAHHTAPWDQLYQRGYLSPPRVPQPEDGAALQPGPL